MEKYIYMQNPASTDIGYYMDNYQAIIAQHLSKGLLATYGIDAISCCYILPRDPTENYSIL